MFYHLVVVIGIGTCGTAPCFGHSELQYIILFYFWIEILSIFFSAQKQFDGYRTCVFLSHSMRGNMREKIEGIQIHFFT